MQNILTTIKTRYSKDRTLQQGVKIGKTIWLTLLILIIFFIIGELVARQEFFQSQLIAPGIGSSHRQFEIQLGKLMRVVDEEGNIDCIIIGSSTVLEGFNPEQFSSAFKEKTGLNTTCYNFGVDGLTTAGAGVVSQVLVEKFHPQIFIYGSDPRDYTYPLDSPENTSITNSPWIQYLLWKDNILGWLYDHSLLLQYQESLYQVLHLQFYRELLRYQNWQESARKGYLEISKARVSVSKPPSQNADTHYVKVYSDLLSDYQLLPENISGLEQVVSQQDQGVKVIIVEMPIAPGYTDFFPNGTKDYEEYINMVNETVKASNVPFLHPQSDIAFPITGWTDYNHLNPEGTKLFSKWLGAKVADMYIGGNVPPSVP